MLSDSHGRGCSERIKNQLSSNFEVCGFVKPGVSSSILTNTASTETTKLTRKDSIVLWSGSNDVSNCKTTVGIKNTLHFVMNNIHTNIIVVNVPHRCDLPMSSGVNREVSSFNRKLEKCLKSFNCVTLIKTSSSRENFTKHGMHLNNLGKSNVASQIVKCIHTMINKVVKTPIKLDWKADSCKEDLAVSSSGEERQQEKIPFTLPCKRIRRSPTNRSEDFLW